VPITNFNAELWSMPMTNVAMISERADGIPGRNRPGARIQHHYRGGNFIMLGDQDFSLQKRSVNRTTDQVPPRTTLQFARAYQSQAHEMTEAIAAVMLYAQAGLNWLRADPPDLEGVRRAFDGIAGDGKRACETLVQLRALMEPYTVEEASDLQADGTGEKSIA
jgi:hypothetical protein